MILVFQCLVKKKSVYKFLLLKKSGNLNFLLLKWELYQIIKAIFIGVKYKRLEIFKFINETIERYREIAPNKQADSLITSKKSFLYITFMVGLY